jgi:hypothetical protein
VIGLTRLPRAPLVSACARRTLWIGRSGTARLEAIDTASGRVVRRVHHRVGVLLAVAAGRVWTAFRDGEISAEAAAARRATHSRANPESQARYGR